MEGEVLGGIVVGVDSMGQMASFCTVGFLLFYEPVPTLKFYNDNSRFQMLELPNVQSLELMSFALCHSLTL